jgi:hypothetical protein
MTGTRWGMFNVGARAGLTGLAMAVGLAACGSSSSSSSSSATSTTSAAAPAASSSTTTTQAAGGATSKPGAAAPGTKLTIGQPATVAYRPPGTTNGSKNATLRLTVASFEKGALSDFNGIKLDASQKASTPYYVKVHVTNLGPHTIDVDGTSAAVEGVDNTGNTQQSITFIGDFPRCTDKASTTPMPTGQSYDNCLTFLVPGGITKVAYSGTDDYINSPVTWSPK